MYPSAQCRGVGVVDHHCEGDVRLGCEMSNNRAAETGAVGAVTGIVGEGAVKDLELVDVGGEVGDGAGWGSTAAGGHRSGVSSGVSGEREEVEGNEEDEKVADVK